LLFLIVLYLCGEAGHWTTSRTGTRVSGVLAAALTGALASVSGGVAL
jgi:hypothetical protein